MEPIGICPSRELVFVQWEMRFYSSSLSGNRSFHELWGFGVQDFLILGRGGFGNLGFCILDYSIWLPSDLGFSYLCLPADKRGGFGV